MISIGLKRACETEVAAAVQWQGQQHLWIPSVSVVVAEPHHADLTLVVVHQGGGHDNSHEER